MTVSEILPVALLSVTGALQAAANTAADTVYFNTEKASFLTV